MNRLIVCGIATPFVAPIEVRDRPGSPEFPVTCPGGQQEASERAFAGPTLGGLFVLGGSVLTAEGSEEQEGRVGFCIDAEWTRGMRSVKWGELWHRILFTVIDDSQPSHRQTASAMPVPEESPSEVNDGV